MEKPTGVIQKIIESLQQINALNTYSPIEKDIILHNLRAAYMIFLNIKADEQSAENRVEKLFEEEVEHEALNSIQGRMEHEEWRMEDEELKMEPIVEIEEPIEEEILEEEPIIVEKPVVEEEILEEEFVEEEPIIEEPIEEEELIEEKPLEEKEEHLLEEMSPSLRIKSEIEGVPEGRGSLCETSSESDIEIEEPIPEPLFTEAPLVEKNVVLQDDLLEFIPDAKPRSHSLFDEIDMPKSEKKSLNDLLEKKDDNSLGAKFQQSFIPDLTKAIAINEKFAFIRELFHNSGVDFSNAIQKLNECENIDAAFILMEELKHQYLWDTTSSAYLSLCDLVRRRFI